MTVYLSVEAISRLIGMIYDCAIDPDLWPATLTAFREELGFANAALSLQAFPSGKMLLNVTSGIPQPWAEKMMEYGKDVVDVWGGAEVMRRLPLDEPAVLTRVNPAGVSAATTNRYYRQWAEPQGLIDVLAITVARDRLSVGSIGMGRHERMGPVGDGEVAMARIFVPHLQRAMTISRMLEIKTVAAANFESVLDALATPIVTVDALLGLVYANPTAEQVLARGDVLRLRAGRVRAVSSSVESALASAVAQAARDESAIGRRGFGIPARDEGGCINALYVMPLARGTRRRNIAPGAVAAIFLAPAASSFRAAGELVSALFDLTPTEARVFEHIAAGATVADTASALGIGLSTVRTHLLRLFDKLDVHRQADLIKLAAAFTIPVQDG
ncbi:MAG: hypothetical protein JOZ42_01770 [Acetobacteraceae bacterium]|nr:hypothetical protein [Acetobacteraceae bacterium]